MGVIYLPPRVGERYEIIKRLRQLNVLVAGWGEVPIEQLRDILEAEEEKARKKKVEDRPKRTYPVKEVGQILRDYLDWK